MNELNEFWNKVRSYDYPKAINTYLGYVNVAAAFASIVVRVVFGVPALLLLGIPSVGPLVKEAVNKELNKGKS